MGVIPTLSEVMKYPRFRAECLLVLFQISYRFSKLFRTHRALIARAQVLFDVGFLRRSDRILHVRKEKSVRVFRRCWWAGFLHREVPLISISLYTTLSFSKHRLVCTVKVFSVNPTMAAISLKGNSS